MRRQANPQIQVARLPSVGPMLSFAGNSNARALSHTRGNPYVNRPRLSVLRDRQTPRGPLIRVFESELDFLLEIAAVTRTAAARAAPSLARSGRAAEEGMEEIGERVSTERLVHFFFGHRAES